MTDRPYKTIKDRPYKPATYRGYNLYYMSFGKVQVLDERGLIFKNLRLAINWINREVNIQ